MWKDDASRHVWILAYTAVRGVGYLAHSSALKSDTHAALLERPLAVDEARASGDRPQDTIPPTNLQMFTARAPP